MLWSLFGTVVVPIVLVWSGRPVGQAALAALALLSLCLLGYLALRLSARHRREVVPEQPGPALRRPVQAVAQEPEAEAPGPVVRGPLFRDELPDVQ